MNKKTHRSLSLSRQNPPLACFFFQLRNFNSYYSSKHHQTVICLLSEAADDLFHFKAAAEGSVNQLHLYRF